jgi:hypothetical protein
MLNHSPVAFGGLRHAHANGVKPPGLLLLPSLLSLLTAVEIAIASGLKCLH